MLHIMCSRSTCSAAAFALHSGKYLARQTLALRGVVPMLAAPMSDGSGEAWAQVRAADLHPQPQLHAHRVGERCMPQEMLSEAVDAAQ